MSDWRKGVLADEVAHLEAGVSVNADDRPHGVGERGVLKTSALSGGVFKEEENKAIWPKEVNRARVSPVADSILVSRMNTPALVGESAYVADHWPELFLPDRIWLLQMHDRSRCSVRWIAHLLQSHYAKNYVSLNATGTSGSMKNLPKSRLLAMPVVWPPHVEQRHIAEILDTLDEAIRKTEQIIAKLKQVKQGFLHDLLTRGIDDNGELRDPHRCPNDFVRTAIGLLPGSWNTAPLSHAAELQVGYAFKSSHFSDHDGVRLLRGENVGYGSPDWSDTKRLPDMHATGMSEYLLREGDVIIGMDRTFTKSGAKVSVLGPGDVPAMLVQRVGRFVPRAATRGFLIQLLRWPVFHAKLLEQQKGMDIPHLSKSEILTPFIPLPPTAEQTKIAHVLQQADAREAVEVQLAEKLSKTKLGLMEDLLSGRVRVTNHPVKGVRSQDDPEQLGLAL